MTHSNSTAEVPRRDRPEALPSLTGFRAIAATSVFFAHVGFFFSAGALGPLTSRIGEGSRAGVTFFFILSGAILAYNYRERVAVWRFYRNRVARIYPVYILAFVTGALVLAADDKSLSFLSPSVIFQNVFIQQGWFKSNGTDIIPGTAWTLSCELLFYLAFPAVLLALRAIPKRLYSAAVAVVLIIAVTAPGLVAEHLARDGYFLAPISRFPEFVLGCLIGIGLEQAISNPGSFLRRRANLLLAAAVLTTAAVTAVLPVFPDWLEFAGAYTPLVAVLIVAGAAADRNGGSWFGARWLVVAGLWSYSFYCLHTVVGHTITGAMGARPGIALGTIGALVFFVAAWAAAAIVYRYWEEPWRERISGKAPAESRWSLLTRRLARAN